MKKVNGTDYVMVDEAAAELTLHHRTIRRLIKDEEIEITRIGGRILIHPRAVAEYIRHQTVPAKELENLLGLDGSGATARRNY